MGVRWSVAYPLSTRLVEALMRARGVHVDHATSNQWVVQARPQLEDAFHRRTRPMWVSWRMAETYMRVKGVWRSLSRAVDPYDETMGCLLPDNRDKEAA